MTDTASQSGASAPSPERGPVVTFEEPVLVGVDDHERISFERQQRRRHAGLFLVRLMVAVTLCALAPFVSDHSATWTAVIAIGYLPLTGVMATSPRGGGHVGRVLGQVADVALVTAFQADAGQVHEITLAPLLIVATHAWAHDRTAGISAAGLFAAGAFVADLTGFGDAPVGLTLSSLLVALVIVSVISDQRFVESRATSGLRLVHDKAEAILAGIADAVVTTSPEGRVRDVNRAARNVLGCEDDVSGTTCVATLGLRDGVRNFDCAGRCELLEERATTVEVSRIGPNGQRQPMLASAVPLLDAEGTIVEVIHSLRDITSVKQADEAKTLFLATASHELKTPLTVIRGFAQMLRVAELDEAQRRSATTAIESRAAQLAAIVDRLLMTSRIEAGRVELAPRMHVIADVLVQRGQEMRAGTSRSFVLDVASDLPPVWVDLDALTTVLDHLFENAVKYSPNGGDIVVRTEVRDDDVVVHISDEGVGMTEEQRAHCFERFWQAEGSDVRRFGGTGIGLYIVRSLVLAMHGVIDVDSTPGAGTTFHLALRRTPKGPSVVPDDRRSDFELMPVQTSVIGELVRQASGAVEHRRGT